MRYEQDSQPSSADAVAAATDGNAVCLMALETITEIYSPTRYTRQFQRHPEGCLIWHRTLGHRETWHIKY